MFYRFPKSLNTDEKYNKLSIHAKYLYMFLLARSDLSEKHGWIDDEGKIYIYCAREEMAEIIEATRQTAVKVFKQLTDAELVTVGKKNGHGSPRLYVKNLLSKNELYFKGDTKSPQDFEGDEISKALLEQFINS